MLICALDGKKIILFCILGTYKCVSLFLSSVICIYLLACACSAHSDQQEWLPFGRHPDDYNWDFTVVHMQNLDENPQK